MQLSSYDRGEENILTGEKISINPETQIRALIPR